MANKKQFLKIPYGGYYQEATPPETPDLTHVEKGSRAGELLRRYWQPICLSDEVGELPKRERVFGEDIVVFRTTDDEVAILDLHCPHRGTSLEYGLCEKTGLRCCYHGWLIGPDGSILETPGDPPGSTLKDRLMHGAYPAKEYNGLIFGYFGPPEELPEFPIYDSFEYDGDLMRPYSLHYPCNWLQVHENVMDPAHAVFLHTRISYSHFADAWGELPEMDFLETPTGMIYVTSRRWKDNIWVRSNDIVLPNIAQVGHIWEDGQKELKEFARVGITRWTSPVDNENCKVIGWRHFHPEVNPLGVGDPDKCGVESVDFVGQDGSRTYEERQRVPGDFDAQISQRKIARHALEHLTYCDKGVVLLRRLLLRELKRLESKEPLCASPHLSEGRIPTYCHDTVVEVPEKPDWDDDELVRKVGTDLTEIVVKGDYHSADDRIDQVRLRIRDYVNGLKAQAAE
jgi:phenylpropionate dioxygenase-like ring-hydroxylating dioxygenase large terminal subunit